VLHAMQRDPRTGSDARRIQSSIGPRQVHLTGYCERLKRRTAAEFRETPVIAGRCSAWVHPAAMLAILRSASFPGKVSKTGIRVHPCIRG